MFETLAIIVAAAANLIALATLPFGLMRPTSLQARRAVHVALACGVVAFIAWLALPAIHAAAARDAMAAWSPEDRKLVTDSVPGMRLDPTYSIETLMETPYFWPVPFVVALVLRYRAVRLRRDERPSALTES